MKTLLIALGLVMIIEGIPYFTMPDQVKSVASKITEMESRALRMIGFGLMICGLVTVAFLKS